MRILLATHQLPPREAGGVGLLTAHLAAVLQQDGHRVAVLAGSEERLARGRAAIEEVEEVAPGVTTLRLVRPARPRVASFFESFVDPWAESLMERALRKHAPDVLHLQHTLNLGARLVGLGLGVGAAVVATVHDFWPICQRIVLARPDNEPCPGPLGGLRCASCLALPGGRRVARGGGPPAGTAPWLGGLRLAAGAAARLGPCVLRTRIVRGAYSRAHRVTCPAPFVAALLARHGFPADKLVVVDYGIPPLPVGVATVPRPRAPFRFGFLGTLGPHKGAHVALQALRHLGGHAVTLQVHGGPLRDPDLRRALEVAEGDGTAAYRGLYDEQDLPQILAGLDALVIPSLWRETGPMVWMEAAAAGLPVVASRVGALCGRVSHGTDGLLVQPEDPAALGSAMRQVIERYDRLRQGALKLRVRTVRDVAGDLLRVYHQARRARG